MKEILKNARKYTVSKKKDAQIINELNILRNSKPTPVPGGYFIFLTNTIMGNYKKIAAFVAAIAIIAVVGLSGVLNSQTTYASHLENAEKALQELQMIQNEGAETNEERVKELVQEIMNETNAALALAEKEAAGEKLQKALQDVQQVQEKSMVMFQKYEGEGNAATGEALKEMEQVRERVREMLGEQSGEMVQEQTMEQNQNQEQKHLQNAEEALGKMEVMQNQGEEADPVQVKTLAHEVVQETGSALEIAEQKQEGEEKKQALMEVQAVQEKSMNMFKNFEEDAVGEALQEAEQNHERVRKMLGDQTGEMVQEQTMDQNKMHSGQ